MLKRYENASDLNPGLRSSPKGFTIQAQWATKHIRRDISNIKEVIDELKAGQARLEGLMEEMKELARGAGEGSRATGWKTENAQTGIGTSQ